MERKRFTQEQKEEALNMMTIGNLTQQQIADEVGCSVGALALWKKESQDKRKASTSDGPRKKRSKKTKSKKSKPSLQSERPVNDFNVDQISKEFWNNNYRGVDLFLHPHDISAEKVKELVNAAITYTCKYLSK